MSRWKSVVLIGGVVLCLLLMPGPAGLAKKPVRPPDPPPPPPVEAQYVVLDLGEGDYLASNNHGEVVVRFWLDIDGDGRPDKCEEDVLIPIDTDGDGFWDTTRAVPVPRPDLEWITAAIGPLQPGEELDLGSSQIRGISDAGVVVGTVGACVYRPDPSWPLWYCYDRSFICRPMFDEQGEFVAYSDPENLGLCQEDPDGAGTDTIVNTVVGDNRNEGQMMNASGTVVGRSSGGGVGSAFRIAPEEVDGQLLWFADDDSDGVNDLSELLDCDPASGGGADAVDDAGRVYVCDGQDFVVLPDGTAALVGSLADKLRVHAGSTAGLAVGEYDTVEVYKRKVRGFSGWREFPVMGPFIIQGVDTDGDGDPDRWFRDQDGDGRNDQLVPLGVLEGYTDECRATDVNKLGQIVGQGLAVVTEGKDSVTVARALIWVDGTAVDLNTLIAEPGIVLRTAVAVTDSGEIICGGRDADGNDHVYLLMPIPAE
jgi:hypothetical protein